MADTLTEALQYLTSPVRNRYFYGKLLDVYHFEMEQHYHNRKRWLLNRLGLGTGVLCGLEIALTDNNQVSISRGVAIDPYGREIIVPQGYCIENPRQPTDARGQPDGDPLEEGSLTICLAYHECDAEPVPVLVGDCDTQEQCAPSVIRERFRIRLIAGLPDDLPGQVDAEECGIIFPPESGEDFNRRATAGETLSDACPVPDDVCVILGTITLAPGSDDDVPSPVITVDPWTYRTTTYSNAMLFDLLLCLAERLDDCCRTQTLTLRYVSGDAQSADPGTTLEQPLVVEVVDPDGNAVEGVTVAFRARGGGGSVDPATRTTGANGRAATRATLSEGPGLNTFEAALGDGSQHVLFMAVSQGEGGGEPPDIDLPVVRRVWPENAALLANQAGEDAMRLLRDWAERPRLALTFNREMSQQRLQRPAPWLRVFQVFDMGEIVLRRAMLELIDVSANDEGSVATYELVEIQPRETSRFLALINARGRTIVDQSDPPLLLDAEFDGSEIPAELLRRIWDESDNDNEIVFGTDPERSRVWDGFADTGAVLPQSGDGSEGGFFHSWFALEIN